MIDQQLRTAIAGRRLRQLTFKEKSPVMDLTSTAAWVDRQRAARCRDLCGDSGPDKSHGLVKSFRPGKKCAFMTSSQVP